MLNRGAQSLKQQGTGRELPRKRTNPLRSNATKMKSETWVQNQLQVSDVSDEESAQRPQRVCFLFSAVVLDSLQHTDGSAHCEPHAETYVGSSADWFLVFRLELTINECDNNMKDVLWKRHCEQWPWQINSARNGNAQHTTSPFLDVMSHLLLKKGFFHISPNAVERKRMFMCLLLKSCYHSFTVTSRASLYVPIGKQPHNDNKQKSWQEVLWRWL